MEWSKIDVRRNHFKEVLLLDDKEIDLYSIDKCLTFKITKVETNMSCDYIDTESKTVSYCTIQPPKQ